jgi:hypothetical protein
MTGNAQVGPRRSSSVMNSRRFIRSPRRPAAAGTTEAQHRLPSLCSMSLRLRRKPPAASYQRRRGLQISLLAHNRALHYLANHPLTEDERAQLTEVVHGYTGPCDVVAAREGLAWLRERYRERGERAPF